MDYKRLKSWEQLDNEKDWQLPLFYLYGVIVVSMGILFWAISINL
jgi:hypothetical protein